MAATPQEPDALGKVCARGRGRAALRGPGSVHGAQEAWQDGTSAGEC